MAKLLEEEVRVDAGENLSALADEGSSAELLTACTGCVSCNDGGPSCVSCVCVSTGPACNAKVYEVKELSYGASKDGYKL